MPWRTSGDQPDGVGMEWVQPAPHHPDPEYRRYMAAEEKPELTVGPGARKDAAMYGITGVPGTGKTSIADRLAHHGFPVLHLSTTYDRYVLEHDTERDTQVVDEERWASEFPKFSGIVEGQLAHLLPCDRIVVLRCRPDILSCRLRERGYHAAKVAENCLAEALDAILIETLEVFPPNQVYELDTTDKTIGECADLTEGFFQGVIPPSHGAIDWSSYIGMME